MDKDEGKTGKQEQRGHPRQGDTQASQSMQAMSQQSGISDQSGSWHQKGDSHEAGAGAAGEGESDDIGMDWK